MPNKKSSLQAPSPRRNIALCYIRLSVTQSPDDDNSPERQTANCVQFCEFMGWTPEFYKDAEGHKSGTKEETRPEWLKLKQRLGDPDVVALVANDLSRFHRKGFRMGQLVELCKQYGLQLVKAAEKKSLDINDVTVTMWIMMEALFNEYYAEDIARKMRDSVRFRKEKGIIVGGIPFGTVRPKRDGGLGRRHGG
jgi:DNA invertase Pin-like site-specific DNA recombinase